jgi:hypothetical protein
MALNFTLAPASFDIRSHDLPRQVSKHHINNKNLVLSSHVKIDL